jgi:hypothetical protein
MKNGAICHMAKLVLASALLASCSGERTIEHTSSRDFSGQKEETRLERSDPQSTSSFTWEDVDAALGQGNWYCIDGWPTSVSVLNVPQGFVVAYPLISLDKQDRRYYFGENVPGGGLATAWLQDELPNNVCTEAQPIISRNDIDALFGSSNWYCLSDTPNGIKVRNVPSDFVVQSPVALLDKLDIRYKKGDVVPSNGPATAWLQGNYPQDQCR